MADKDIKSKSNNSITARSAALAVINAVLNDKRFCEDAMQEYVYIKNADGGDKFDRRDRAFIKALSEGTIERCITIDYVINNYSSKPVHKLKPFIRGLLRMSVYQIMYMDKVPDNAAVNEAVKIAVKKGFHGLKGYVNGVLRSIARGYKELEINDTSVKYSVPKWLEEHLKTELGEKKTIDALEYFLGKTELTLRPDCPKNLEWLRKEFEKAGIEYKSGNIIPEALRISQSVAVSELPGYKEGRFAVMDESSMLPAHIICEYIKEDNKKKYRVLDMCAAPGGKVLYLAGFAGEKVDCMAKDLTSGKISKLEENIKRLNIKNVKTSVFDATLFDENECEKYDIIIADLPCSGFGVIAKKPDIKYNTMEEDSKKLACIQKKMLDNAAKYVRNNGIIVFSTCTVSRYENEDNVSDFLKRHTDFSLFDIEKNIPHIIRKGCYKEMQVKIAPGQFDTDGFFVAVFKKAGK